MSAPQPQDPAAHTAPPTPNQAAAHALKEGAKGMAQDAVMRRFYGEMRRRLPRPVFKVLFGGKDVGEVAEAEIKRRVGAAIFGCVLSFFIFSAMAAVVICAAAVVVFAVLSG